MDQESLIAMAYLLGSDYTDGIKGVGIVNSTEVIQTFMRPAAFSKPCAPAVTAGELFCNTKESADRITTSLLSFKQWVDNYAADMISEGNLDLRPHHDHSANRLEMKSSSADNAIEEVGGKYAVSEEVLQAEKLVISSLNYVFLLQFLSLIAPV